MMIRASLIAVAVVASSAAGTVSHTERSEQTAQPEKGLIPSPQEHAETIAAMKPPKRKRPVIAVLAHNDGTEVTDFLIPYSVLTQSGVADVEAVALRSEPVKLWPALTIKANTTVKDFDRRYPDGADYIIVPFMTQPNDPEVVRWIQQQAATGAVIVGICAGAITLSEAGMLKDRAATTYWISVPQLRSSNPGMRWIPNRRYIVDRKVVTTTGISASLPVSLALVEAIAGRRKANDLARELGAEGWHGGHDRAAFGAEQAARVRRYSPPTKDGKRTRFGVTVEEAVDEMALAFAADAYTRASRERFVAVTKDAQPVKTRRGLVLIPDESGKMDVTISPIARDKPAQGLDRALASIAANLGEEAAVVAALGMEYPVPPAR